MSRIAGRFAALAAAGRKGLVPYIAAGDPSPDLTVPLMHALARAGCDVVGGTAAALCRRRVLDAGL